MAGISLVVHKRREGFHTWTSHQNNICSNEVSGRNVTTHVCDAEWIVIHSGGSRA